MSISSVSLELIILSNIIYYFVLIDAYSMIDKLYKQVTGVFLMEI